MPQLAKDLTNILDEGFEMPSCTLDLQDLIDSCIAYYNDMPYCRSTTKNYKLKLNELITELKVFALIKSVGVNTSLSRTFIRSRMVRAIRAKPTPN